MRGLHFSGMLALCLASFASLSAQVPNQGFESWIDPGQPESWITYNLGEPYFVQQGPAYSGSYGARCTALDINGLFMPPTLAGFFPIAQRYTSFSIWVMVDQISLDDNPYIHILLFKNNSLIGGGEIIVPSTTISYTQFSGTIDYITSDVPDSCFIQITMIDENVGDLGPNSSFVVDDFALSTTATGVGELAPHIPTSPRLYPNFPNPFNPSTTIAFDVATTGPVEITVHDIVGQEVAVLTRGEMSPGHYTATFDASSFASGLYLVRMRASDYTAVKKIMLVK